MFKIKTLLLIIILIFSLNAHSQVGRLNIINGAVGVQTPHDWRLHSHVEFQLFPHSLLSNVSVGVVTLQAGYAWYLAERATIRTATQLVTGGYYPNPTCDDDYFQYIDLIPIAFTVYPFNRDYIGVDVYTLYNFKETRLGVSLALVVRFQ